MFDIQKTDIEYMRSSSSARMKRIARYVEHLEKSRVQELKEELVALEPLMEPAFSILSIIENWEDVKGQEHGFYKAVAITSKQTAKKWVLIDANEFEELTKGDCHE